MSVDWLSIETEYITSDISLRKIADKYDVSFATVRHRSKTEEWVKKRKEYKHNIVTASTQNSACKEIDRLNKLQNCSNKLDELLSNFIDTSGKTLSAMDLNFLTRSLKDAVNIKRDVYNVLTTAQEEKMRIDNEKLKLEQQKAQADKVDNNITVVFKGEIEEYAK